VPLKWKKTLIALDRFESAGVFDVNGDGKPNIVSGAYWYETPDIRTRHLIGELEVYDEEYYDHFATVPLDIAGHAREGSRRMDFVTGGWWGDTLRWRENPGDPTVEWPVHVIAHTGNVETARSWDVDGDGQLEVVPNTPGGPLVVYKLVTGVDGHGIGEFTAHTIDAQAQGHGLGFGDVNGNGRGDFVLAKGWLEAPADPFAGEWMFHPDFDLGHASIPILVVDVNGSGLNDLIVGQAHPYGLDWWEQRVDADGAHNWIQHPIDPFNSQYHDLQWVDLDGDGQCELVTGKRYRAHRGRDPGGHDDLGIYYFKWNGESFCKQVIDYGPPGVGKGCGLAFAIADLTGNGRLDIVAPGKDGLVLYENLGL